MKHEHDSFFFCRFDVDLKLFIWLMLRMIGFSFLVALNIV